MRHRLRNAFQLCTNNVIISLQNFIFNSKMRYLNKQFIPQITQLNYMIKYLLSVELKKTDLFPDLFPIDPIYFQRPVLFPGLKGVFSSFCNFNFEQNM